MAELLEFIPNAFAREAFRLSQRVYQGFAPIDLMKQTIGPEGYGRLTIIERVDGKIHLFVIDTAKIGATEAADYAVRPIGYLHIVQTGIRLN